MNTITCPKCGTVNPAAAMNCKQCHINLQFAVQNLPEIERIKAKEQAVESAAPPLQREPISRSTRVKRWLASISIIVVSIGLWNFAIHPLFDSLNYSDQPDFPGRPVYDQYGRISLTLHRELEKCGYNNSDFEELRRIPDGRQLVYDGKGRLIVTIEKAQITTGITEIKLSCPAK